MIEKQIFSDKLKKAEKDLNMKHPAFAVFLGFPLASVIKWHRGLVLPSPERQEIILAKIKSKLG